ncbi:MAG: acyltransferase family protein, partial [Hyphomicrobium sp.]
MLLAMTVVAAHAYGFVAVGGKLAVQMFYMISGFLISYILTEARTYESVKNFYLNRALRIFPIYWVIALLALALHACMTLAGQNNFFDLYNKLELSGIAALIVSNIIIFGQDLIMFTVVRAGEFQFATDVSKTELSVWQGLLVPQAWSLGVELSFYVIAPFVLRRTAWILLCLV